MRIERRSGFKDIACGNTFTVALSEEGQLLVWGKDLFSNKTIWTPKPYVPEKRFVSVSAGEKHCAAICEEGMVHTWGVEGGWFSTSGYLGHGGSSSVEFPK
jgi:alpha-tubulin suppressor-like RCC1 family protein